MRLPWIALSKGIALLTLILPMFLMNTVLAVEFKVGVKVGDWVKYGDISVSWNGTGTEPESVTETKQVNWLKFEVQSVSGTTVNMTITLYFKNGTDASQTYSCDVESEDCRFAIAANLKKGDPVTTRSNAPTLNDTVTRRYAGASRSVNVLEVTSTVEGITDKFTSYYDQATGIMLEYNWVHGWSYYGGSYHGRYEEFSMKVTEINMWTADFLGMISGNLLYIMIIVVAMVVIAGTTGFILYRKKKLSVKPPSPPSTITVSIKYECQAR